MLYESYQAQRDLTAPARAFAGLANWTLGELPDRFTDNRFADVFSITPSVTQRLLRETVSQFPDRG